MDLPTFFQKRERHRADIGVDPAVSWIISRCKELEAMVSGLRATQTFNVCGHTDHFGFANSLFAFNQLARGFNVTGNKDRLRQLEAFQTDGVFRISLKPLQASTDI